MDLITFVENFEKELKKRQIDFLRMDFVHGYLTGICIAPELIKPSEWLSPLFEDQIEFKDKDDADFVFSFLFDLFNRIIKELQHNDFSPLFVEFENEEGVQELFVRDWCRGLIYATVNFYNDKIYQYIEEDEDQLRDVLVLYYLAEWGDKSVPVIQELIADLEKDNLETIDLIPDIIRYMYDYFQKKKIIQIATAGRII